VDTARRPGSRGWRLLIQPQSVAMGGDRRLLRDAHEGALTAPSLAKELGFMLESRPRAMMNRRFYRFGFYFPRPLAEGTG